MIMLLAQVQAQLRGLLDLTAHIMWKKIMCGKLSKIPALNS